MDRERLTARASRLEISGWIDREYRASRMMEIDRGNYIIDAGSSRDICIAGLFEYSVHDFSWLGKCRKILEEVGNVAYELILY